MSSIENSYIPKRKREEDEGSTEVKRVKSQDQDPSTSCAMGDVAIPVLSTTPPPTNEAALAQKYAELRAVVSIGITEHNRDTLSRYWTIYKEIIQLGAAQDDIKHALGTDLLEKFPKMDYQLALHEESYRPQFIFQAIEHLKYSKSNFPRFFRMMGMDLHNEQDQVMVERILDEAPDLLFDFVLGSVQQAKQWRETHEKLIVRLLTKLREKLSEAMISPEKLAGVDFVFQNMIEHPRYIILEELQRGIEISRMIQSDFEERLATIEISEENASTVYKAAYEMKSPPLMVNYIKYMFSKENLTIYNLLFISSICSNEHFRTRMESFFLTEEGKEFLIKNRVNIHYYCPFVKEFVLSHYPVEESRNARLYPMEICDGLIRCAFDLPAQEPVETVSRVAPLIENNDFDDGIRVQYLNQEGYDAGALRRDFFSKLFRALSDKFQFREKIPNWKPEMENVLKGIGVIWWFFISEDNKIMTGEVFHPDFFRGVLTFEIEEIDKPFEQIQNNKLFEKMTGILTENDPMYKYSSGLKQFMYWEGVDLESENWQEQMEFIRSAEEMTGIDLPTEGLNAEKIREYKALLLDEYVDRFKMRYKTLHAIAAGMGVGGWSFLHLINAQVLQNRIQGAFARDKFCQAFRFGGNKRGEVKQWVREWIDTKSDEELKGFLQYVYAAAVVPVRKIKVYLFETVTIPKVQSCSREIHLPADIDKEGLINLFNFYTTAGNETFNSL